MELELESGCDTEVAAAAQRPEQLGLLTLAHVQIFGTGRHEIDRHQVVAGEAVQRPSQPNPPPSVKPPTPVCDSVPPVVASPNACVSPSTSDHKHPPATRTVTNAGSTCTASMGDRSIIKAPSAIA